MQKLFLEYQCDPSLKKTHGRLKDAFDCSDDLPSILGTHLIENTNSCPGCDAECSSDLELQQHINDNHDVNNFQLKD